MSQENEKKTGDFALERERRARPMTARPFLAIPGFSRVRPDFSETRRVRPTCLCPPHKYRDRSLLSFCRLCRFSQLYIYRIDYRPSSFLISPGRFFFSLLSFSLSRSDRRTDFSVRRKQSLSARLDKSFLARDYNRER